jgi:hypothetical protein
MAATVHNIAGTFSGNTDNVNGDRFNLSEYHEKVEVTHSGSSGTVTVAGVPLTAGQSASISLQGQREPSIARDARGFPFEGNRAQTIAENSADGVTAAFTWDTAANGFDVTSTAAIPITVVGT